MLLEALRNWSADNQIDGGIDEALTLKDIKVGGWQNIRCKILWVCEVANNKWIAFVWDGTDTPPMTIKNKLDDELENPIPLQLEPFTLSRDILCTFPPVGTVLRVIIDQNNEKFGLHFLRIGRWVLFINIICEIDAGLWHGVLMPSTKLRYLSDNDPLIIQAQRNYDERLSSKWARMPSWSFPWPSHITETDCKDVPFVTLMNILTYPEVTAKYRCVVKIVAAFPWRAEDLRSSDGTYKIRLTLEDPTARIHAFLYAEDGEKFFGSCSTADDIKRMWNRLLGIVVGDDGEDIKDAPRNPEWIACCIKSYYHDKSDIWGSRRYRVFATEIVD